MVEIEFQIAKSWDWVVICAHFGPEFSILVTWRRKLFDHVYGPFFLSEKKKLDSTHFNLKSVFEKKKKGKGLFVMF